ncbi:helix-turn-helix transcriptional regulator [Humibacter sp. RRB41]|uniref:ArsR/SmtB family transcription factor n=1 Tax=Humibacter sp. RRB41 TaxID=2919946 RepID=UPI001FAA0E89|nr:metalloregulator ArsR/SmtB family transcription factor [Humibacter sp. RRB41]
MVVESTSLDDLSDAEVDRLFRALADATRRDILVRTMAGDQSVTTLARGYAMSFAAVQKHVAVLESARLVRKERRGREQLVRAVPETVRRANALLQRYESLWRERAAGIERILAEDGFTPGNEPTAEHTAQGDTNTTRRRRP